MPQVEEAVNVLSAVSILHSSSSDATSRRAADAFLSAWRSSPAAWRTSLLLLLQPGVQLADTDRYFFACCLRFACQRSSGDILDPSILGSIIDQTSLALLSSVYRQSHAVSNQLAIALAALAVRSTNWDATRIVSDFASLFQRSTQSMHDSVAPEAAGACLPLDLVPCLALLQLLQAMLTEARNKQCSVHPGRRAAVASALASSPEPIRWVRLALAVQGPHAAACSIQGLALVEEYCNQGSPPVGLDSHEDLLAAICQRVLNPETAKAAAQCLSAAFTAAGPDPAKAAPIGSSASAAAAGNAGPRPRSASASGPPGNHAWSAVPRDLKLLFQLLQHWQATGYTVPRYRTPQVPSSAQSNSEGQQPGDSNSAGGVPPECMLAACNVLSSACTILLRPALGPAGALREQAMTRARSPLGATAGMPADMRIQQASIVGYQHYFQVVADQLLLHLQHCDDEVALVAAAFFSGTYLPELKAALLPATSPEHRQALRDQHASLLQRLTESLVLRTQLRPEVAAVATADARDIPDDARTVRRELAGMLRDISSLVGHTAMLQFMAALVQPGYQQLDAGLPATPGQRSPEVQVWVRLECALYAANVVTGRWVSETWNARKALGGTPQPPSAMRQHGKLRRMVAGGLDGSVQEDLEEDENESDGSMDGEDDSDEDEEDDENSILTDGTVSAVAAGAAAATAAISGTPLAAGAGAGSGPGSGAGSVAGAGGEAMPPPPPPRWAPPRRSRSSLALESEADAAVAQLVEVAAMSSVHPNGSCKLAGTALTLLGGLSCWYADKVSRAMKAARNSNHNSTPSATNSAPMTAAPHVAPPLPPIRSQSSPLGNPDDEVDRARLPNLHPSVAAAAAAGSYSRSQSSPLNDPESGAAAAGGPGSQQSPLPSVLLAVLQAIKSDDAKLSRNGATTLQRLCAHEGLARHLLTNHSSWVDTLVGVYQSRGGMLQRAGPHEDSSTEELLLMTLCRLACLSGGNRQLLLHLATPQVQAVRQSLAELAAANDAAAAPNAMGTLFGAAAGLTCATLVTQCSKSLDILTAIMESCRLGGRGSRNGGAGGGVGGSFGRSPPPPTVAAPSPSDGGAGSNAEASATAMAAADQVLGLTRAVWWVLHEGLQPKLLQSHGSDLATGLSTFMAAAMKTFLAAHRVLPPGAQLPPLPATSDLTGGGPSPGPTTVTQLLLEPLSWAMNLLEVVPVLLLSTPRIVDLLLSCLDALAALQQQQAVSVAANANGNGGSGASDSPTVADLPALIDRLGSVVSSALVAGFANLVNPLSSSQVDSVHTSSLLRLCCSCMRLLPACFVHSPSTPDLMLSATLVACYSLDMDQCRAAMDWCQCLCTQPFAGAVPPPPPPPMRPSSPGNAMQPPQPLPLSPMSTAAYTSLRTWLDGTAGAKVVQALLLSASGSMPSCLVLPVSTALHRIWRGVGTDRFLRWADMAMIMLVPSPPSPWQHLKPEHRSALLRDLVSPECVHDIPRFKRVVKSLCGGKRKGEGLTGTTGTGATLPSHRGARPSVSSRSLGQDRNMGMGHQEQLMRHVAPDRVRSLSRDRLMMPGIHNMHGGMHAGMANIGLGLNALTPGMGLNTMGSSMNAMGQGAGVNAMTQSMNAINQGLLPQTSPQLVQLASMQQLPLAMQAQPMSMQHQQMGMQSGMQSGLQSGLQSPQMSMQSSQMGLQSPQMGMQSGLQQQGYQQHPHGGGMSWLDLTGHQSQYGMLMGGPLPQAQYGVLPMNMMPQAMNYLQQQQQQQQQRRL